MKRARHGAAYVGFLIALPPVLFCLGGMLTLFGILHARQATYASLYAVARQGADGRPVTLFEPDRHAVCRLAGPPVETFSTLAADEVESAEKLGYEPPSELRRTRFTAVTTCRHLSSVPALPTPTRVRTRYSIVLLPKPAED